MQRTEPDAELPNVELAARDNRGSGIERAFLGASLDDLRGFPADVRRQAGYQLDRVQRGLEPDDGGRCHRSARGFARSGLATVPVPSG